MKEESAEFNCKKPWANKETGDVDNEIAWTEFYLGTLYRQVEYHETRLKEYLEIKAWWIRFINYCLSGD